MIKELHRQVLIYFSENVSPFPIKIYSEVQESDLIFPITETISNLLISYGIKQSEYDLYNRKTETKLIKSIDFIQISEIKVVLKDPSNYEKLLFIQENIFDNEIIKQIDDDLSKIPSNYHIEAIKNENPERKSLGLELVVNKPEIREIKEEIKNDSPSKIKNSQIHPFLYSGSLQTSPSNGIFLNKGEIGYFSFFYGDFNDFAPAYLPYEIIRKPKGITKEEIFSGLERLNSGELKCIDKEILAKQKGLIGDMLRKIMQSIADGRGVVGVSLPVRIFEPRSLLERIVDWWKFAPIFLNKAAKCEDQIERMKLVVAFAISGLYVSVSQMKPFNPILGETYQASFEDGTLIFGEHTSHHPPISNFLLIGKGWRFYGRYEYIAKGNTTFNEIKLTQEGPNIVEFPNFNEKITFNLPSSKLCGLISGDRLLKWGGCMKFTTNNSSLKTVLKIGSNKKVGNGGMFAKKLSDLIEGKLYYAKPESENKKTKKKAEQMKEDLKFIDVQKEIGVFEGSWLENLIISGEEIWNINKYQPCIQIPIKNPLPSDCRFREDLICLKGGDIIVAEKWKLKLEERQRFEKKLRHKNLKKK